MMCTSFLVGVSSLSGGKSHIVIKPTFEHKFGLTNF